MRFAEEIRAEASGLGECDVRTMIFRSEYFVHQTPNEVHILVVDLDEAASALGQQLPGRQQPVTQAVKVGVDAYRPKCRGTP